MFFFSHLCFNLKANIPSSKGYWESTNQNYNFKLMEINELKNKLESALSAVDLENLNTLTEEAMQKYPEEGFGYYYFGEKLLKEASKDMPSIEWAFGKASYLEQTNLVYLKKYAESLVEQDKYDEAAKIYGNIYNLDNKDTEALFGLGRYELSEERRNYPHALFYFSAIENPGSEVYEGMALAYAGLGDFESALGMIDYALSTNFNIETAVSKLQILEKSENYTLMPDVLEKIIELEPNNFGFQFEYALSLFKAGENENAEENFEKAFAIMPGDMEFDSNFYRPYAENAIALGKYQKAIEALDKCIENDKNLDNFIYELKAKALAGSGDLPAALKLWDKIIGLYSYNVLLQQIAKLGKTELIANSGDIDTAEKEYTALENELNKQANPPQGLIRDLSFGKALIALKKANKAEAYKYAAKCVGFDMDKAKKLISSSLLDYLIESRSNILNSKTAISNNSSHPLLKKVIGKAWVFNQFKLSAPEEVAEDAEQRAAFEKSVEDFQSKLPDFAMVIGEKEIFLDLPYTNHQKPIRNMIYLYEVEKEKENLLQIKLYAIDGLGEFTAKLKIEDNEIVFNPAEGEVYRLNQISDLKRISYKTQRNFFRQFGYLNICGKIGLDANTENAVDALLDY